MKYIIILPDGVADLPIEELGGKTPLEVAKHPNMDRIAREGIAGLAHTIPSGFKPGSDVGCMSVFGYDPRKYYTGRAPLEAAAQGIALKEGDVAFRCNTVFIKDGIMVDYSAGHIESADSHALIRSVNEKLGKKYGVEFHAGVGYRHLMIVRSSKFEVQSKDLAKTECVPAHDISDKPVADFATKGPAAEWLGKILCEAAGILNEHPVNQRRIKEGKRPANQLWFWGQGTATAFPPFQKEYGLRAGCISAVDIVRGLGTLTGFDSIKVPGITGYFDTNYKGKAEYALESLDDHDLVLIHIEPTDEAGHMGDVQKKIQAIEDTDRLVVATVLEGLEKRKEPFAVMVVPDHPTSTKLKTHISDPVPFAIFSHQGLKDDIQAYNETAVKQSDHRFEEGYQLMAFFLCQGKKQV